MPKLVLSSYWNQIPVQVVGPDGKDANSLLKRLGFSKPWNDGKELDYRGWQRIALPEDWSIVLNNHSMLLLDEQGRKRGTIRNALRHIPPRKGSLTAALTEVLSKKRGSKDKQKRRKPLVPRLVLSGCLSKGVSSTLDPRGPYDFWVEDFSGKRVFAVRVAFRASTSRKKKLEKLKKAEKKVNDWLEKNYESWWNPLAYWHKPEFQ